MGDRPPTGEPEKEKEEEREEKRRKKRKKKKKKTPPVDWATGHAQCDGRFRVRVPLAAFCERPQGPAPGGERGAAKGALGPEDRPRRRGETALGCLTLVSRCRAAGFT